MTGRDLWADGYAAGNAGLLKAVETAEVLGAARERERIIKLLTDIAVVTKNDEVAVMELLSAIVALIKGETK